MNTVENICTAIGRGVLCDSLGVSKAAISNAISDGKFPPRWYRVVTDLCRKKGIACSDDLFRFISTSKTDAA